MKRHPRWAWALGGTALALGLATLAVGTAPVLGWLLARQGVSTEALTGSLWTGLRAERLTRQGPDLRLEMQGLSLAPLRWVDGRWHTALEATSIAVDAPPSTEPPTTPEAWVERLRSPWGLSVDRVRVARLTAQGQTVQDLDASVHWGGSDEVLRVVLNHVRWPEGGWQGRASLRLQAPQRLEASASIDTPHGRWQAHGDGPLSHWPWRADLQADQRAIAQLDGVLSPLAAQPLQRLSVQLQGLDLQRLHPQAPRTAWSGTLAIAPTPEDRALRVQAALNNPLALRLDEGGWPLVRVAAQARLTPERWSELQLDALELQLGSPERSAGRVVLTAPWRWAPGAPTAARAALRLDAVALRALDANWPAWRLDGPIGLSRVADAGRIDLDLRLLATALAADHRPWRLDAAVQVSSPPEGWRLQVPDATLSQTQDGGTLRVKGQWQSLPRGWRTELDAEAVGLRIDLPAQPWPARWTGHSRVALSQTPAQLTGDVLMTLAPGSAWAELPAEGRFTWRADAASSAWEGQLQVNAGGGSPPASVQAASQGLPPPRQASALAQASAWQPQRLQWRWPNLLALKPLWQPWWQRLAGRTEGEIQLHDDPLQARLALRADDLLLQRGPKDAAWKLASLQARWVDGEGELSGRDAQAEGWQLQHGHWQGGLQRAWRWELLGRSPLSWGAEPLPPWRWHGQGPAPKNGADSDPRAWLAQGWQMALGPQDTRGEAPSDAADWLRWSNFGWRWHPDGPQVALQGGMLSLWGEPFPNPEWQHDGRTSAPVTRLVVAGRVQAARWLARWQPGAAWQGDLLTDWRLRWERGALELDMARVEGDLRLDGESLGLQTLSARLQRDASGAAQARLSLGGPVIGQADLDARAAADGRLAGQLQARWPALHWLQPWLPAGLEWRGSAELSAQLGGTRERPQLNGQGRLDLARLQHASSGLGGQNGRIRWHFDENAVVLDEARLQGLGEGDSGGQLSAQGQWRWGPGSPHAQLQLQATQFRLLQRFDRQLTLSGDAQADVDARRLRLRGALRADQGVFDISQGDAPSLDDDVIVRRAAADPAAPKAAASAWQRDVQVQFDLGQRLRIQGRGLASRLTGQLQVQERDGRPAQWTGLVEMGGGRYKAYGQTLDIESGELRFTGALDNPRLDILALRPDLEVRVGVRATGSAQTPRIRLYSEPEMADNDKLAWLLLGRAPDELGRNDSALLQRAALALVSGEGDNPATQLLDKLGLTEFSVSNSDDAGTTLRLGAQLSRRWSVGYERSLNAATGSWQLVYRLGQRFRLRAQSGTDSAVDALWLWRYD